MCLILQMLTHMLSTLAYRLLWSSRTTTQGASHEEDSFSVHNRNAAFGRHRVCGRPGLGHLETQCGEVKILRHSTNGWYACLQRIERAVHPRTKVNRCGWQGSLQQDDLS